MATTTTPISSALRNGAILSSARRSQRIWRFSEALAQLCRMLMAEKMRSRFVCSMETEKLINLFLYFCFERKIEFPYPSLFSFSLPINNLQTFFFHTSHNRILKLDSMIQESGGNQAYPIVWRSVVETNFFKIMGLAGVFWKNKIKKRTCQKLAFWSNSLKY